MTTKRLPDPGKSVVFREQAGAQGKGGLFGPQWAFAAFYWRSIRLVAALMFRKRETVADTAAVRRRFQELSLRYIEDLSRRGIGFFEYEGFEDVESWRGSLICPNHPSILDAISLFAKIPKAGCVVGSNPLRNPLLSTLARMGDFIPRNPALRMVRECRSRLAHGENIIVFPEGTRTSDGAINPFHDGPALAAIKAEAPVRTILIECNTLFLSQRYSFFQCAPWPVIFRLSPGKVFHPACDDDPRAFTRELEDYFRASLRRDGDKIEKTRSEVGQ
jgi:1-acyl-sn-glycerol-3-phosphate acyltransferase